MHTQETNIKDFKLDQIDLDGLNENITSRVLSQDKYKGVENKEDIIFKPNIQRLGVVTSNKGMVAVVDEEAVTTLCPNKSLKLEIYKKSRTTLVMNFGPEFILTLDVDELLKHHPGKKGVSLRDHMQERFEYNSRIRNNMRMFKDFLINE